MTPLWAMWLYSTGVLLYVEDGKTKMHEGFGGFTAALLDAIKTEMGPGYTWELIALNSPKTTPKKLAIWLGKTYTFIKGLNPTLVWVNKGISVLIIKDAEGKPVPWGCLKIMGVAMSPKIMKRLAVLAWRSYLNGTFKTVIYTKPGRRIPPLVGALSVCIFTSRKNEHLYDGVMAIRPSLVGALIDKVNTGVEEKTEMVKEELRKSFRFNIRIILPKLPKEFIAELFPVKSKSRKRRSTWLKRRAAFAETYGNGFAAKGDCMLGDEEKMWADIHLHIYPNGKPETPSLTDCAYLQMFRQEQYGRVRTNPQMLAHFFEWLLDGHIQKALRMQINTMIMNLIEGTLPKFIDPVSREIGNHGEERAVDSINAFSYRYIKFSRWLPVWKSPGLLMAIYTMCENFLLPKGTKDRERRFPVPFSKSASLTSRSAVINAGLRIPELRFGEVYYHRVGMVVDDRIFAAVCYELGTADEDDHVYNMLRIVERDVWIPVFTEGVHTHNLMLEAGDLVAILVRPPTGQRTNGRMRGSEYYVLKVRGAVDRLGIVNIGGTKWNNGTWINKSGPIPTIDLKTRPMMISEVPLVDEDGKTIEPTFNPVGLKTPEEFTFDFAWEQALVAPNAAKAFGRYCLLVMETWWSWVMMPFHADMGDIVDSMQQKPCAEDVASLNVCVYDLAETVLEAVEGGAQIEKVVAPGLFKMIASILGVDFEERDAFVESYMSSTWDGPFTNLIEFHKAEMARFREVARGHILESAERARVAVKDIEITMKDAKGAPGLIVAMKKTERKYRDARREMYPDLSSDLAPADYDEIGTQTVEWLLEHYTRDQVVRLMLEAYAFRMRAALAGDGTTINRTLAASDRDFMNGRLLDVLITAVGTLDFPEVPSL